MKASIILILSVIVYAKADLDRSWWKHATIYEIDLWTFKDSDGDGIGDLAGLTSKMDYLKDLGISVIKLHPIYSSTEQITETYGVDNFIDVHYTLGQMDDFDDLMTESKARGIKIILDINLNHCHETHEWFRKSLDRIDPYTNYFVWEDPIKMEKEWMIQPPNFWRLSGSQANSWKWEEKRKQFYYTAHGYSLPDFNLRNKNLKEELQDVLKFWLDKGISGFNILDKKHYLEDQNISQRLGTRFYHQDTYEYLRELRQFIDMYNEGDTEYERILMTNTEGYSNEAYKYVGNKDLPLLHFVSMIFLDSWYFRYESAKSIMNTIKEEIKPINDGVMVEWQIYDGSRPFKDDQFFLIIYSITALLPGIWHMMYGVEIGMKSYEKLERFEMNKKFVLHDRTFLAMQWDDSKNAGFSDSNYPIQEPNPDYTMVNVEKQKNERNSILHLTQDLLKVRETNAHKYGDLKFYSIKKFIISIVRIYENEIIIGLVCWENIPQLINLKEELKDIPNLPARLTVMAATSNFIYQKGDKINISQFTMKPFSTVVLINENI